MLIRSLGGSNSPAQLGNRDYCRFNRHSGCWIIRRLLSFRLLVAERYGLGKVDTVLQGAFSMTPPPHLPHSASQFLFRSSPKEMFHGPSIDNVRHHLHNMHSCMHATTRFEIYMCHNKEHSDYKTKQTHTHENLQLQSTNIFPDV